MKTFFNAIHPVPSHILEEYLSKGRVVRFKRREIITREGQVEHFLYLVQEGVQRAYFLKEEKEHTIAFTYAPSFSGIPESFFTQTHSRYYLEAITPSTLLRISYQDHQQMMARHREIETLSRKATEMLLVSYLSRHLELLSYNMEERFLAFINRSPHLLNMVPHKYLASYLHLDPTNFSKLLHGHRR